jgi:hypothetical protein
MNFRRTFEIEITRLDRIPVFFKARGYKVELNLSANYRFTRGSSWTAGIMRDVKGFPTRVEVILTKQDSNTFQVLVLYDLDTLGRVISIKSQETIKTELQCLQDFCQRVAGP